VLVIATGFRNADWERVFISSSLKWDFDLQLAGGLSAAMLINMRERLGYCQVCYLGDEVRDAARILPRSIVISILAVAVLYLMMNISVLASISRKGIEPSEAPCLIYQPLALRPFLNFVS
jgi:amino acid transporter